MNKALHALQQQVQRWRATAPKRSKIPEHIKAATINLLKYYSPSALSKQLGFGKSTVYKWQQSVCLTADTQAELVEINIPMAIASIENNMHITFQHGDFSAQTAMTPTQFRQVFLQTGSVAC
jgi:hypothetical protein